MWLPSTRTMPNPRFAAPGSIPITTCMGIDSGIPAGCLPRSGFRCAFAVLFTAKEQRSELGRELLEDLLGDVEVGEDFVDVVLVVERVEQLQQPFGVVPFQLDRAFRFDRDRRRRDLDP